MKNKTWFVLFKVNILIIQIYWFRYYRTALVDRKSEQQNHLFLTEGIGVGK